MDNNKKVTLDNLENAFIAILDEFVDECEQDVNEAVVESSKVAINKLKKETPPGAGRYHDWAEYQSGWKRKSSKNTIGDVSVHIYNSKKPGLTHLLEKGHVLPDGRRTRAFPHIEDAAEAAIDDLMRRLKNGL